MDPNSRTTFSGFANRAVPGHVLPAKTSHHHSDGYYSFSPVHQAATSNPQPWQSCSARNSDSFVPVRPPTSRLSSAETLPNYHLSSCVEGIPVSRPRVIAPESFQISPAAAHGRASNGAPLATYLMDPSLMFRPVEGMNVYQNRLQAGFPPTKRQVKLPADDQGEVDADGSHRIAHTLTACCRCRQRKTRCDPTLPRCLPCERSGSICEYFDTTKGKKINRNYVVRLQERVRVLEAELGQYTDEDDYPKSHEDFVRPGGLVRLNETDETPRYLGPSSGIAMTRLLMEEAKKYTDSKRISELIPDVRTRRQPPVPMSAISQRSQSFSMPTISRKKSFPKRSDVPATTLPSRPVMDQMLDGYIQKGQLMTPILHETILTNMVDEVYNGSQDPYQNFVVRMVLAINMQKMHIDYSGLADSFYLAAMQYFESVVNAKDLKTLQALVLLGQYSLLTPTRTAVYYVVGLATRICQQLGLSDEKSITMPPTDPLTLDMRRRLSWAVTTMEFGLAQSMGRPNGFAKTDDRVDVGFFETVGDENISENGITPGPPSPKKLVAIHFCKMRLCQAEIRRVLYERKHIEPKDDRHPWFAATEAKTEQWLNSAPEDPSWCKPWFSGRYHTMVISMHRPTPQVPKPSLKSVNKCYDSAAYIINLSSKQMMAGAVDMTWVFLLTLYMAMNTILWSVSYADIRTSHPREEVEELINICLDIIDQCAERWPGTSAALDLYSTFAKACLQSYSAKEPSLSNGSNLTTPQSLSDTNSPPASEISNATTMSNVKPPQFNTPQFGFVFDANPEPIPNFNFDNPFGNQPSFRSNSIFHNPATTDGTGRRFSYFPPDFTQGTETSLTDDSTPGSDNATISPPMLTPPQHLPSPPDSIPAQNSGTPMMGTPMMTAPALTTPSTMGHGSPIPVSMPGGMPQQAQRTPQAAFTIPALPHQHVPQGQRPLPPATTVTDWFNPPPPFISPYAFGGGGGAGFWGENPSAVPGLGVANPGFNGFAPGRQGSLSRDQQIELMDVFENEGVSDLNTYLNMGMDFTMNNVNQGINWNTNSAFRG